MNAELYNEYQEYMEQNVGRLASTFKIPVYELEDAIMDGFVTVEKAFNPEKASIKTYMNRCFLNTAISTSAKHFTYGEDENRQVKYIDPERQVMLAGVIESLSRSSQFIIDMVLAEKIPGLKGVKRNGGKERCTVKKWLVERGWHPKKVDGCFLEIKQALKEI